MLETIKVGLEFWDATNLVLILCGIFFMHEIAVYYTESGIAPSSGIVWIQSPLIPYLKQIYEYIKRNKNNDLDINNLYKNAIQEQITLTKFKSMIINTPYSTRFIIPRCCGWIELFILFLLFGYTNYIVSTQIILFWLLLSVSIIQIIGAIYCKYIHQQYKYLHKTLTNCKIKLAIDSNLNDKPYELNQIPFQMWCNLSFANYLHFNTYIYSKPALYFLYCFKALSCSLIALGILIGYFEYFLFIIIFTFDILNVYCFKKQKKNCRPIPISLFLIVFILMEVCHIYANIFIFMFVISWFGLNIYGLINCTGEYYMILLKLYWFVGSILILSIHNKKCKSSTKIGEIMFDSEYTIYRLFTLYVFYISHQFELVKQNHWSRRSVLLYLLFGFM